MMCFAGCKIEIRFIMKVSKAEKCVQVFTVVASMTRIIQSQSKKNQ